MKASLACGGTTVSIGFALIDDDDVGFYRESDVESRQRGEKLANTALSFVR